MRDSREGEIGDYNGRRVLRSLVPTERQRTDGASYSPGFVAPPPEAPSVPRAQRVAAYVKSLDPRSIDGPKRPIAVFGVLALFGGLDDLALGTILPELRAEFAVGASSALALSTFLGLFGLALLPLFGYLADRVKRVYLVRFSVILGNAISAMSAFAGSFTQFIAIRSASGLATQAQGPAGLTLITDYYTTSAMGRVLIVMPALGQLTSLAGPAVAGLVVSIAGWRVAVLVLGTLATLAGCATFLLREPIRGGMDRLEQGLPPEAAKQETKPLSFAESFRTAKGITTVRMLWYATPFLQIGVTSMGLYQALYFAEVFGLSPAQRGALASVGSAVGFFGLLLAQPVAGRLLAVRPGRIFVIMAMMSAAQCLVVIALSISGSLLLSIAVTLPLTFFGALVQPATAALMLQLIPARLRGAGIALSAPWTLAGTLGFFLLLQIFPVGADGVRGLALSLMPFQLLGALILFRASGGVDADIRRARAYELAEADIRKAKEQGRTRLLVCRGVEVEYAGTKVLSDIDLGLDEGELVALVGTNGAGKSTLLKAIAGLVLPTNGAIFHDGREITNEPAYASAARGIVFMPGGAATFPNLTVEANLKTAGWLQQDDEVVRARTAEVIEMFPEIASRMGDLAGNLSGGEQQMVALAQALMGSPRLLMIDELSLGLAPAVVERLLETLRRVHAEGTTIVLVEQSLNVALTVAERAVFMDKGKIRFDGPTADLMRRPDLIRSVFMGGATVAQKMVRAEAGMGAPAGDAFRAENLTVEFGGVAALRGVSIEAAPGEAVGIIGPNGAGKTTFFDAITGFVPLTSGSVWLGSVELTGMDTAARSRAGLGRAFQDARLFPSLTVRENIAVALEHRANRSWAMAALWASRHRGSESRLYRRVDGLVEILGLSSFANKFVGELSTGSRRAVEVAMMMAHEPQVLLLDEPSSGLAQAEVEELGPVLTRLRRETGCSMLVIEHDVPLVASISDRMVAMHLGEALVDGPPAMVLQHPKVLSSYLTASEQVIHRSDRMGAIAAALGLERQT